MALMCAALLGASCTAPASLRDDSPPLDESRAKDIVAIIDVISVREYERDSCFGYEIEDASGRAYVLCSSPPPFEVWARVVKQLYGPPLGGSISFKTSSHWGPRFLTDGNRKLVQLVTDGKVLVMPNESASNVGASFAGTMFVPVYPREIGWLPCGTNALKERVAFRTPADMFGEIWQKPQMIPLTEEQLAEEDFYFFRRGQRQYPRFGISVVAIEKFLSEKQPAGRDFYCP